MAEFLLLGLGLLSLLASTRQLSLRTRAIFWIVGAAFLVVAASIGFGKDHSVLIRLIQDAASDPEGVVGTPLFHVLTGNWSQVGDALKPMFAAFLAFSVGMALLALLAFTPGEALERVVRPLSIAVIGAAFGAYFALAIVAIGVGGTFERQVYAGIVKTSDVIDADTFKFGDVRVRLSGVDAPELKQQCIGPSGKVSCGAAAREKMLALVEGALVTCWNSEDGKSAATSPRTRPSKLEESYGRPLVRCLVRSTGHPEFDLGERLLAMGIAASSTDKKDSAEATTAAAGEPGAVCNLTPSAWRENAEARRKFLGETYQSLLASPQPGVTCSRPKN